MLRSTTLAVTFLAAWMGADASRLDFLHPPDPPAGDRISPPTADTTPQPMDRPPRAARVTLSLGDRRLSVTMELPAMADSVRFALQPWAGVAFADGVTNLRARSASGELETHRRGDSEWVVIGTETDYSLTYEIVSRKTSFVGQTREDLFRPTLLPNWAFLWGHAVFLTSGAYATTPVRLRIEAGRYERAFINLPDLDSIADLWELSRSLIVAGDYRTSSLMVDGGEVQILIHGRDWQFADRDFVDAVRRIFESQVELMGFYPAIKQMVVLVEGAPHSKGGTVVANAIALYPDPAAPLDDSTHETLRIVAHEHFHTWNGSFLRPESGRGEGWYKWFQEGVTEYQAWSTLYGLGIVSTEGMIGVINRFLREYYSNPVAFTATSADLEARYWSDASYNRLPYAKGFLLGLLIDAGIRLQSGGASGIGDWLAGVFRADEGSYDDARMRAELEAITGTDWGAFYDTFVLGSDELEILGFCNYSGAACSRPQLEIFEFGFRTDVGSLTGGAEVTEVLAGSNAQAAGMRVGDVLTGRVSYWNGDPTKPATFWVERGTGEVEISYLPSAREAIPQISKGARSEEALESLWR